MPAPRPARRPPSRRGSTLAALLATFGLASPLTAHADGLPPEVTQALQRARLPDEALAVVVQETGSGRVLLSHQARLPLNPGSVVKLLTTAAALEQLGPAWTWSTPVWIQGTARDGVLDGSVFIRGSGDPKLVIERVWLLLRRLQQAGVREIRGDIVLDGSAFAVPPAAAGDFDGQPLRPYNVRPAALLLNYRVVTYTFVPEPERGSARVISEPELAGSVVDRGVPLASGPCEDWAGALKAAFEPGRARFGGRYPAACGTQSWPVADPQPETYDARLIQALWTEMGGRLGGRVRDGRAPAEAPPSFEFRSPPLLEVVREINKFSNNVMAQQLMLSLPTAVEGGGVATPERSREHLRRWLAERIGDLPAETVIDNGSGLSRTQRLSAQQIAHLLLRLHDGPVMSELMSSLPVSGVDGTMRRSRAGAGRAHLKTGSLDDVVARAGYVLSDSGRRYVFVALIQHPRAAAARPVVDALLDWTLRDGPTR